jgi:parvulin-like peptidyl-prolyl isomerase
MTDLLQVGNQTIAAAELLPLLVRYQMLPQLKRELIIDQAIAAIDAPPETLDRVKQQFLQQQRISSAAELQSWMSHYSIDDRQLDAIITRQHKLETFKHLTWGNQLEAQFLSRKGQFDQVIYSLLRVQDIGAAQEFYFRLQAGEQTFAELAREYSQGPEAQTGGLIGPIELAAIHPTLAKMLAMSQPNQLWSPARLNDWYVIVRLEKFLPAELDEPMRQRLLNELFNEWVQAQLHLNPTLPVVA